MKKMDFGAGFKNGVLLLGLIIAVHVIMTKPDAIQNLMMHSPAVQDGTTASPLTGARRNDAHPVDQDESDLLKFVYSDEDHGALDQFFKNKVMDARFAEGSAMVQNAHLKTGSSGIQDASFLKIPHESRVNQPADILGIDTFASDFSCPV